MKNVIIKLVQMKRHESGKVQRIELNIRGVLTSKNRPEPSDHDIAEILFRSEFAINDDGQIRAHIFTDDSAV